MPEKIDHWQVKNDLEKFGRIIRLKMHFLNEPSPSFSEVPAFKTPSKWTNIIKDIQLEFYLPEIEDEIMQIDKQGQNYPNLTKKECEAMKELMNGCNIIIKPAGKGSGIFIWDMQDYLRECENQLTDINVYEKVEGDLVTATNKKICKVLDNMIKKKEIDEKLANYLYIKLPQLGRFYLLPKIHKRTMSVPGRPVISNNSIATENILAFLDFHLKPLVTKVPHILEDTCDFLTRITEIKDLPEDALLVSFDVVRLYLYIPHEEDIEIMEEFLNQSEVKDISTKSLCDLAAIILKNNFFEIGDKVYHQLLGTAIGTKFAPTYANLFMTGLEKKIFGNTNFKPLLWLQYLDDIFCIWTEGFDRLQEFYQYLNSFHSTIKFTMEFSKEQINFLDAKISQKEGTLQTDLHCKSTDTHQFLHFRSCHCYSYKKSILYGQAI